MDNNFIEEVGIEFDKKFNNIIGSSFECMDAEKTLTDIKQFISQKLQEAQLKAREELKKGIVEMMGSINFLEDITGKNNRELILSRYRLLKDKIKNI